jgi:hypothetical protein
MELAKKSWVESRIAALITAGTLVSLTSAITDWATSATVVIGNALKTGYNKLTGYTKIDYRPTGGGTNSYALQVRHNVGGTSGLFSSVDQEVHAVANGTASIRGTQGVAVLDSTFTVTGATYNGLYGQFRSDGTFAGSGFGAAIYGVVEASAAMTASHICSLWLDTHQALAITGSYQLIYCTENGAEPLDQVMYIRTPGARALMELDTCTNIVSATATTAGTSKKIKITIDGVAYYINVYTGA